jgi:hypothetical protein
MNEAGSAIAVNMLPSTGLAGEFYFVVHDVEGDAAAQVAAAPL